MDIITFVFYLYLESLAFDGTIYRFKHSHNVSAFNPAADGPLPGSHAIQKMPALMLQRLNRLDAGTDDVAIPDLESKFAIVQWFVFNRTDALLKHAYLLNSVQVIEDDPLITFDDDDLSSFVWIGPANMNVSKNIVRIAERDEPNIVTAVAQYLASDRTHPLGRAAEEVVEDRDVVRGEVPKGINVASDGAQVCPASV